MANKDYISDELLAAYLDGNTSKEEMAQVLGAIETNAELQEVLNIAMQLEDEELPVQIAAEGGRNLCDIQCEAYVLGRHGVKTSVDELLEVAKENHWIRRAGTPLNCIGNLIEYMGLKVTRKKKASIEDIRVALKEGKGVIVAVDCDKLYPEKADEEDATNHAVVVIGINSETITLYDPEKPTETNIKLHLFMSAWKESRCYMVGVVM